MDKLRKVAISQLSPDLEDHETKKIEAVVALIWPYSSSTRRAALLLAEPDYRLRRHKGQVRIQLEGASAQNVAQSKIGIGDKVVLALHGVQWVDNTDGEQAINTPGKSVSWEAKFRRLLQLQITHVDGTEVSVDVNSSVLSPPATTLFDDEDDPRTPGETLYRNKGKDQSVLRESLLWKATRKSIDAPIYSPYDPFDDEAAYPRKRPRRSWHGVNSWHLADRAGSPAEAGENPPAGDSIESDGSSRELVGAISPTNSTKLTSHDLSREATPEPWTEVVAPSEGDDDIPRSIESLGTRQVTTRNSSFRVFQDAKTDDPPDRASFGKVRGPSLVMEDFEMTSTSAVGVPTILETTGRNEHTSSERHYAMQDSESSKIASTSKNKGALADDTLGSSPLLLIAKDLQEAGTRPLLQTSDSSILMPPPDTSRKVVSPSPKTAPVSFANSERSESETAARRARKSNRATEYRTKPQVPGEEGTGRSPPAAPLTPRQTAAASPSQDTNLLRVSDLAAHRRRTSSASSRRSPNGPFGDHFRSKTPFGLVGPLEEDAVFIEEFPKLKPTEQNDQAGHEDQHKGGRPVELVNVLVEASRRNAKALSEGDPPFDPTGNDPFETSPPNVTPLIGLGSPLLRQREPGSDSTPWPLDGTFGATSTQNFEASLPTGLVSPLPTSQIAQSSDPAADTVKDSQQGSQASSNLHDGGSLLHSVHKDSVALSAQLPLPLFDRPPTPPLTQDTTLKGVATVSPEISTTPIIADHQALLRESSMYELPEAIRAWFTPIRTSQISSGVDQTTDEDRLGPSQHANNERVNDNTTERSLTEMPPLSTELVTQTRAELQRMALDAIAQSDAALEGNHETGLARSHAELRKEDVSKGFRTALSYYTPLHPARLRPFLNGAASQSSLDSTVDVMAVVTSLPRSAIKAEKGPRDWYTSFHVADPSSWNMRQQSDVEWPQGDITVQCFQGGKKGKDMLPAADVGDVVLLTEFNVTSHENKVGLLNKRAGSGWCVWRFSPDRSTHAKEEVKGPPVEFGEEERAYAHSLRDWWMALS